jgi:hypothetical protein
MKRIIAAILVSLSLVACANINSTLTEIKQTVAKTVTVDNLDTLQASYGLALTAVVNYRRLCTSKVINKSCWAIIAKMQPYEDKAYKSLVALRNFIKNNPDMDNTSFIQLSKSAINEFKNIIVKEGIN